MTAESSLMPFKTRQALLQKWPFTTDLPENEVIEFYLDKGRLIFCAYHLSVEGDSQPSTAKNISETQSPRNLDALNNMFTNADAKSLAHHSTSPQMKLINTMERLKTHIASKSVANSPVLKPKDHTRMRSLSTDGRQDIQDSESVGKDGLQSGINTPPVSVASVDARSLLGHESAKSISTSEVSDTAAKVRTQVARTTPTSLDRPSQSPSKRRPLLDFSGMKFNSAFKPSPSIQEDEIQKKLEQFPYRGRVCRVRSRHVFECPSGFELTRWEQSIQVVQNVVRWLEDCQIKLIDRSY